MEASMLHKKAAAANLNVKDCFLLLVRMHAMLSLAVRSYDSDVCLIQVRPGASTASNNVSETSREMQMCQWLSHQGSHQNAD